MNVLNVQELRKSYGTRVVFDGVSFALDEGEKVGFIGVNGSGKSTLFRIVAGLEGHEGGTLAFQRGIRTGYLSQEPEFEPGATILSTVAGGKPDLLDAIREYHAVGEALAAGTGDVDRLLARQERAAGRIDSLGGWDYEHQMENVLTRLGVEQWERPVEGLSGGERKRVALARVLLQAPELLLLDEPTNHLDADTTAWLEEHLESYPGAVMLITHDRYFLDRVVTRMLEVSTGELVGYPGGYTEYLEAKAERMERASVEEAKRQKLIAQELAWVRRSPSARTGKQKARIGRLGGLEAEQKEKRLPNRTTVEMAMNEAPRLGRTVLNLHHVRKSFGERTLIRDLDTMLSAGERIGIIGPNGAGKTTLLRIILGQEPADSGEVEIGKNTRIAYFDQRREDLNPEHSVYEAAADSDWVMVAGQRTHLRSYLETFLFPPEKQRQVVRSLSGGERNRLLLARLFLQDANLLMLDEPTNDLDLVTLQVLESVLADYGGCVVVVTHDRFFLDKVATGLIVFEKDGAVRRHAGNYDLYRRLKEQREAEAAEAAQAHTQARKATAATAAAKADGGKKLSWKEKKELDGMEAAIEKAEARKEELSARLADPALYTGPADELARVTSAFREAGEAVDVLYARWAELEELAG
ncbi:ABC-F family ATP-binding cassette domain-containing protein [Longimicrobium terrae]|uniref:ATP-binding cassette subfamily F protein uup n=1 Tax=Longimicrobium terrae TaxID=1639882 RepID=A0A841GZA4_9BACT|nr:ABC-F family ATP-binding cassette domain-containing protein [Longimicrobium terrae]MBB4636438.1 ATP-binding cassette subfamily F protein uup [Longimicrobium terrae]MBB6071038.1 ATP-binding cassette subfamily F protein uup [Longimicrobium terrae]NNC29059.1 ABC-F family ATP-binding cassette domain-containing protein [Longimicrobium terrae]